MDGLDPADKRHLALLLQRLVMRFCRNAPMTPSPRLATIVDMTKHAAGKYGRSIGRKQQKALVAASNGVWCYVCEESHRWSKTCAERAAKLRSNLPN